MAKSVAVIKMIREDSSTPWGFRLEGGIDLGHALNIQRVSPGSLADRNGLCPGDIILRINNLDTRFLTHEAAKMEIIRSGNDFELTVERGGTYPSKVTMTSATANRQTCPQVDMAQLPALCEPRTCQGTPPPPINYANLKSDYVSNRPSPGVNHNVNPVPFSPTPPNPGEVLVTQTAEGRVQSLGHSAYNSPMGLYSQKHINASFTNTMAAAGADPQNARSVSGGGPIGARMQCCACGDLIRGVFVKVQGRVPIHPECLKCCKCGIGLRNVGYFCVNDNLYCETHAKQAAPPPEHGMKPVVVYK
ncbi:excitatory chemical synaptic transmission [Sparganum proliferum]